MLLFSNLFCGTAELCVAATLVADLVRSGIKIERGEVGNFVVPEDESSSSLLTMIQLLEEGWRSALTT